MPAMADMCIGIFKMFDKTAVKVKEQSSENSGDRKGLL